MKNSFVIEASVHMKLGEGFRVKAGFKELGMYINGMVVYPPNGNHEDWVVYTPGTKASSGWIRMIEFEKKKTIWQELHAECINAVKAYQATNSRSGYKGRDIVPDDIEDGPIDMSDIPFN